MPDQQSAPVTALPGVSVVALDRPRRSQLHRWVRLVVVAIVTYSVAEAVVAIWAGSLASAIPLLSVVEVLSAAAILWQFAAPNPETRERVALRTVGVAFFVLAVYLGYDSTVTLLSRDDPDPDHTLVGFLLALVRLLGMPMLSGLERRAGRALSSASVVAHAKLTRLCTYLSAVLLVGLLANSLLGWAWADPVAALVTAAAALREGVDAWRSDNCAAPGALPTGHAEQADEEAASL